MLPGGFVVLLIYLTSTFTHRLPPRLSERYLSQCRVHLLLRAFEQRHKSPCQLPLLRVFRRKKCVRESSCTWRGVADNPQLSQL
jgi:hypothetical protein